MNWLYLGIFLNVISTIYLIYLDHIEGNNLPASSLIIALILTLLPYITFLTVLYEVMGSRLTKILAKIDFNKVIIKGRNNDTTP